MRFMTFNLRRDFEDDGVNRFNNRKELVKRCIEESGADVIGFQEVLPEALLWLQKELSDYMVVGCGRDPDLGDEATAVAYRRDLFNLIKMDTFWLSETPTVPGSRYADQSDCPRTCTEVVLYRISDKKIFRVYNTHLDHIGSSARLLGVKQILETMGKEPLFGDSPCVLMGDFNAFPEDPEIRYISEEGKLSDFTDKLPGTFHDFGELSVPEKIDYIYASKEWTLERALLTEKLDGNYVSDHYPIIVEMTTK